MSFSKIKNYEIQNLNARKEINKNEMQRVESETNSYKSELLSSDYLLEKKTANELRNLEKKFEEKSNDLSRLDENQKVLEQKKKEKREKIDEVKSERERIDEVLAKKNEALSEKQLNIKNIKGNLTRYKVEYREKNNELRQLVSMHRRSNVANNETKQKRKMPSKTRQQMHNNDYAEIDIENERHVNNLNYAFKK